MGSNQNYSIIIKPKRTPHVQAHIVIADNRLGHLLGVYASVGVMPSYVYGSK